jgi:hypothetical protein
MLDDGERAKADASSIMAAATQLSASRCVKNKTTDIEIQLEQLVPD